MKEEIIMEIRPSEGGQDSKLLIHDMKHIYMKACNLQGYEYNIKNESDFLIEI